MATVIFPEAPRHDESLEWINESFLVSQDFGPSNELSCRQLPYWKTLTKRMSDSYQSLVSLLSKNKKKRFSRRLNSKYVRNEVIVYNVNNSTEKEQESNSVNDWYKREYTNQVGEPPKHDAEERLEKAIIGLKWQSKCIAFDRLFYAPPIQRELMLEQVNWDDTPLALACTCPATICTCSCRKNYLLPAQKIPRRLCPYWFGVKRFLWLFHCAKYPKPAGTLIPKLVAVVNKESAFYRSPKGRIILTQKGPEFCMSGCLQYLVSSSQANALLAAEIAKIQEIDVEGLQEMIQSMLVRILQSGGTKFDVPDEMDTEGYCDGFTCTVSTQTDNDEESDELLMGDYTHVLYASVENTFMSDMDGKKLQISFYNEEPPDPCAFSLSRVFHVDEMKQHLHKMKELYSSISVMIDKYSAKHTSKVDLEGSECCHDYTSCSRKRSGQRIEKTNKKPNEDLEVTTWQKLQKAKSSIRKYLKYIDLSDACDKQSSKTENRRCIPKPDMSRKTDDTNNEIKMMSPTTNSKESVELLNDDIINTPEASDFESGKIKSRRFSVKKSSDKLKYKVSFKDEQSNHEIDCSPCKN